MYLRRTPWTLRYCQAISRTPALFRQSWIRNVLPTSGWLFPDEVNTILLWCFRSKSACTWNFKPSWYFDGFQMWQRGKGWREECVGRALRSRSALFLVGVQSELVAEGEQLNFFTQLDGWWKLTMLYMFATSVQSVFKISENILTNINIELFV